MNSNQDYIINEQGRKIFFVENIQDENLPYVVIIPPYGLTTHSLFKPAYFLHSNKYNIVRFDATDHVGQSDGKIIDFKLSSLIADSKSIIDRYKGKNLFLVGFSLAYPVMLKILESKIPCIKAAVAIVGVVDVAKTIQLAGNFKLETMKSTEEIFGHEVCSSFTKDAVQTKVFHLSDSLDALKNISVPMLMLSARNDEYVDINDVEHIDGSGLDYLKVDIIENCRHEFGRSGETTKILFYKMIHFLNKVSRRSDKVFVPPLTQVIDAGSIENSSINDA